MGTQDGTSERLAPEDEQLFPHLTPENYRVTSPCDALYNCIAHAADDHALVWDPGMLPLPGYFWPNGADRGRGPDSLRSAFEVIGYQLCSNDSFEDGYEKVALYVDSDGDWSHHAAKQDRTTGGWSSKLGSEHDIAHETPHTLSGSLYGNVVYLMRRRVDERV